MMEVEGLDFDTLQEMSDRVAAADGRMEREGGTLRVSIPCA